MRGGRGGIRLMQLERFVDELRTMINEAEKEGGTSIWIAALKDLLNSYELDEGEEG
jgi:hypothetical protein